MPRIFISYRREDSIAYAGRIFDRLRSEFGPADVFMDVDSLDLGVDFVEVLQQTVSSCDTLLAVIGRHWLNDWEGNSPLSNPEDFVRLEIATALERQNIRVVPILVSGARMPRSAELPEGLSGLARRNALVLPDVGFHEALGRLIHSIKRAEQERLERQKAAADQRAEQVPGPRRAVVENRIRVSPEDGLKYVWIPPGKFRMGCSPGDSECSEDETPAHEVTITKGFWIGQTPVTQAAYERVMGKNPSHFKGADRPVDSVNWKQAQEYCRKAGGRLPTEAEWEYAARAGSQTARYGELDDVAWHGGNSGRETHPVAQKQPNAWGLYDTLGNVWEWVADWYNDKYYANSPQQDPQGPASGTRRVLRGGSWNYFQWFLRAAERYRYGPDDWNYSIGFRCAREVFA